MNTEKIERLLDRQPGVDGWFLRHYRTEATTVIHLPVLVSPRPGAGQTEFETSSNPNPREVITSPAENLWVVVYSRFEQESKTWMGEATGQLLSDEESELAAQVAPLVAGAGSQKNTPYTLPPGTTEYPKVELADPALVNASQAEVADLARKFADAVVRAVTDPGVNVSNIELFIHRSQGHVSTSTGVRLDYPLTRVEAEVCFVARPDSSHTGEYTARLKARRLSDLGPETIARLCSRNARLIALAGPPPNRTGPVVLTDEAAADVLERNPLGFHANARFVFEKSSRYEQGKPVTGSAEIKGERLNLVSDPLLSFGSGSEICSSLDASPASRVTIVKDGNYEGLRGTRRYLEYLGLLGKCPGPALPGSNVVVAPGQRKAEDLTGGDTVVVRAFSAWEADPASGDFTCEIRLGELHRGGSVVPFKGGLLVGNWFTALSDVHFSRETIQHGRYHGPKAVRFNNLKVAG